ncbi:MAG TPA: transcription antitermination factor NusB [Ramlibacter sp.]|uniref:transcription antitermination factor NusB n=1 Tax=Ramlibacter sp. TaxID=1917967 RepID=UPI002B9D219C|nr:transcription antitermination factor NusB [Ramlibacter sp.]HVZ46850.1 transcription antitermination factor NusB [Ramlibacter sp.]
MSEATKEGAGTGKAPGKAPEKVPEKVPEKAPEKAPDKTPEKAPPKTPRKSAAKPPRSRAREFALQGLYQHIVGRQEAQAIDDFTRALSGFHKADSVHYDALLRGCIAQASQLDALIEPLLDRKLAELSPIEHAVMWMGAYEFMHCADVPWRVVLNECIELAKEFGGTDGHKYVNGVLSGLAVTLRPAEVQADRASGKARPGEVK